MASMIPIIQDSYPIDDQWDKKLLETDNKHKLSQYNNNIRQQQQQQQQQQHQQHQVQLQLQLQPCSGGAMHNQNHYEWTARMRSLAILVGFMGCTAVSFGAIEAHHLPKDMTPYRRHVFETSNKYHFYHTFAIAIAGLIAKRPHLTGLLFLLGTGMFTISNYYYALTGDDRYIMFTPTGGIFLIAAWFTLMIPF